jgi:lysozyme
MRCSGRGLALTEASEGLRLKAYQDTGGVWTIGYGHTNGVRPNQVITKVVAEQLFEIDNDFAENCVNKYALPCTQGQFDALVDFVFNVGPSQFLSSHLYKYHKAGEYEKAAAEFPKWKYDNGKIEPGLVKRRAAEQLLYTRQEQSGDRQRTDVPERSASSVVYPVPPDQPVVGSQFSPVPTAQASGIVPASSTSRSVFLSQALELARKLIGRG